MSKFVHSVICNGKCDGCPCDMEDEFHRSHGCALDNMPQAMPELNYDEWKEKVGETGDK